MNHKPRQKRLRTAAPQKLTRESVWTVVARGPGMWLSVAALFSVQATNLAPRAGAGGAAGQRGQTPALGWPAPVGENRPWTRWWWMGSAVDTTNLTRLLTEYQKAGIGGVEICPIYGAKGYEDRFIEFLS